MKQLIILSCTIPFGTQSEVKVRERLAQFEETLRGTFSPELQEETNTIIRWIIVPIAPSEQTSPKIECIYPKESLVIEKLKDLTI